MFWLWLLRNKESEVNYIKLWVITRYFCYIYNRHVNTPKLWWCWWHFNVSWISGALTMFPNDSFCYNAHICVNRINEFFIWACLLYTFYIETFLLSCAIKFHLDSEWLNMNAWWRYSYSLINAKFSSTKLLCVIAAFFELWICNWYTNDPTEKCQRFIVRKKV